MAPMRREAPPSVTTLPHGCLPKPNESYTIRNVHDTNGAIYLLVALRPGVISRGAGLHHGRVIERDQHVRGTGQAELQADEEIGEVGEVGEIGEIEGGT